jgi:hypothetical protein
MVLILAQKVLEVRGNTMAWWSGDERELYLFFMSHSHVSERD